MEKLDIIALTEHLSSFISDNRKKRFEEIIQNRTRHITIVLEDIYQPHNASAVLRSCDCFGIQDVHVIENRNFYTVNPDVALGSPKWLNLYKYRGNENNTKECLEKLKKNGYQLIATTPHEKDCNIEDLNINTKTALIFGTELDGISPTVREMADGYVKIPMYGFTESFNISVSAAICLYSTTEKMRKKDIAWQLTDDEKIKIRLDWMRNTINKVELIEEDFLKKMNKEIK